MDGWREEEPEKRMEGQSGVKGEQEEEDAVLQVECR